MIVILVVFGLLGLNRLFQRYDSDVEKLSAFECGIMEMGDARQRFDISFYKIAILFLIFDLEVVLILPYVSIYSSLNLWGYSIYLLILIILTFGLYYELRILSLPASYIE